MTIRSPRSALVLAAVLAVLPVAAFADGESPRLSVFGNIGSVAVTGWNEKTDASAATIAGSLYLEMNDRFSLDTGEFFLHYKLTEPFQQQNAGFLSLPQDVPIPELSLYEAYVRLFPVSWLSLSIGRHRFSWGNGLLLSPSDSFQPSPFQTLAGQMPTTLQNSAAPTGFTGVGAQFFPSSNLTASFGVSVDDALNAGALATDRVRYGGIASCNLGPLDFFLSGVYQPHETLRPGAGGSVDVLGIILRADAGLELIDQYEYPSGSPGLASFSRDTSGTPRPGVSAGMQKIFSWGDDSLSIFGEYLYLGWGYSRDQEKLFLSSASSAALPIPQPVGQHYANLLVSFSRTDAWDWENLFMIDLAGPSIMGSQTVTFLGFKGISLTAGITWLFGDSSTEFGSSDNKLFGTIQAQVDF